MAPTATGNAATNVQAAATNAPHAKAAKASGTAAASKPTLIDLYSGSQASVAITDEALREDIIKGLRGSQTFIIPGSVDNEQDRKFAFRRTLPTTILYSERGLLLYDELVEEPEYYLWSAEINILQKYSHEIALRAFGHSTQHSLSPFQQPIASKKEDYNKQEEQQHLNNGGSFPRNADLEKEKWGDQRVGKHNGGVNGEAGLDGDRSIKCASLVELGAGSLRKVRSSPEQALHVES
jgi:hypothetical protein